MHNGNLRQAASVFAFKSSRWQATQSIQERCCRTILYVMAKRSGTCHCWSKLHGKKSIKNFQLLSSKQSKHNIADALAQTPHSYACHPPSNTCTVISVAAYALRFRQYLWISQPIHQKVLMMHTFPKVQSESTSEVRTCRFLLVRVRVVSLAL